MDKPKLEDFGISQEDVEQVESRTIKIPKALRWASLIVVWMILTAWFYPLIDDVDSPLEQVIIAAIGCSLYAIVGGYFLVGWLVEKIYLNTQQESLRSLPVYQKVSRFQEAKAAYDLWKSEEELRLQRKQQNHWLSLSGEAFEDELARLYSSLGYKVSLTSVTDDQGIDIELEKDGRRTIVQCKRHKKPVGPAVIRELYGALMASGADDAILASTGGFSSGVVEFAHSHPIKLLSLNDILAMQKTIE